MDIEIKKRRQNMKKNANHSHSGGEKFQMTMVVPVSGLVMARFHILECEHSTALKYWEKRRRKEQEKKMREEGKLERMLSWQSSISEASSTTSNMNWDYSFDLSEISNLPEKSQVQDEENKYEAVADMIFDYNLPVSCIDAAASNSKTKYSNLSKKRQSRIFMRLSCLEKSQIDPHIFTEDSLTFLQHPLSSFFIPTTSAQDSQDAVSASITFQPQSPLPNCKV